MPDETQPANQGPAPSGDADPGPPPESAREAEDVARGAIPGEDGPPPDAAAEMAEDLLAQVHAAVNDANTPERPAGPPPGSAPLDLPSFDQDRRQAIPAELDLLADVNLNVKIELGRTRMLVEDVLKLSDGAVVELDKLAGDPVDIYVNDRHVARGEVLVLNDNFCVRINEIVEPEDRRAG